MEFRASRKHARQTAFEHLEPAPEFHGFIVTADEFCCEYLVQFFYKGEFFWLQISIRKLLNESKHVFKIHAVIAKRNVRIHEKQQKLRVKFEVSSSAADATNISLDQMSPLYHFVVRLYISPHTHVIITANDYAHIKHDAILPRFCTLDPQLYGDFITNDGTHARSPVSVCLEILRQYEKHLKLN